MTDTTIEVDGLPVQVDAALYADDPGLVIAQVREARAELRLPEPAEDDVDPDYTARYGKDA